MIVLAACAEPTSPRFEIPAAQAAKSTDAPLFIGEPEPVERFSVTLEARGLLTPGSPTTLIAKVEALRETDQVDVSIVLPEVEEARRNGWQVARRLSGTKLPPVLAQRRAMAEGNRSEYSAILTIPAEGYFRAVVSVRASNRLEFAYGRPVLDAAFREIWLRIDKNGGHVDSVFSPANFPDSLLPVPGVARPKWGKVSRADSLHNQFAGTKLSSEARSGSITLFGGNIARAINGEPGIRTLWYYNYDNEQYEPVADRSSPIMIETPRHGRPITVRSPSQMKQGNTRPVVRN